MKLLNNVITYSSKWKKKLRAMKKILIKNLAGTGIVKYVYFYYAYLECSTNFLNFNVDKIM